LNATRAHTGRATYTWADTQTESDARWHELGGDKT